MTLGGLLNFVRRSQFFDQDAINKLIQESHEQVPPIKEDSVKRRIIKDGEIRIRDSQTVTATDQRTPTEDRGRGSKPFLRKRPTTVKSYPLIHTNNGTLTFPADSTTKFAAGASGWSTTNYISIADHSRLDVTTELSVAFFLKVPTVNPAANAIIMEKADAYQIFLSTTRVLNARIKSGSVWKTAVTHDVSTDSGNWISVVFTYKSTASGQTLYIDAVSESSDSVTGSIDTNSNAFEIGNDNDIHSTLHIAHLSLLSKEVSSGWITNFDGGLLDTSDGNTEITTIPFTSSPDPKPDATSGECRST